MPLLNLVSGVSLNHLLKKVKRETSELTALLHLPEQEWQPLLCQLKLSKHSSQTTLLHLLHSFAMTHAKKTEACLKSELDILLSKDGKEVLESFIMWKTLLLNLLLHNGVKWLISQLELLSQNQTKKWWRLLW